MKSMECISELVKCRESSDTINAPCCANQYVVRVVSFFRSLNLSNVLVRDAWRRRQACLATPHHVAGKSLKRYDHSLLQNVIYQPEEMIRPKCMYLASSPKPSGSRRCQFPD